MRFFLKNLLPSLVFATFQSANPKFIHQYHVFFLFVPSHMHLQSGCAHSNDFSVLMVRSLYSDYFDLSTLISSLTFYKVCWLRVVLFSHAAHTHTHRFQTLSWTWDAMIEKQKIVQCHHCLVKIGDKSRMKWEKMSCAVTYNGEDMVEAGIGSEKSCESEYWKYLRKLRFSAIVVASW